MIEAMVVAASFGVALLAGWLCLWGVLRILC
jgi:hypothetical protein